MGDYAFEQVLTDPAELRALLGEPGERAVRKQIPALDVHCRAFIARSPFMLLGTSAANGTGDVSPRGDAPGFVQVLDDRTLVIPDRPGNRRLDSLRNILEQPGVGLLFLIPGTEETLRVNGHARIVRDEALLARMAVGDKLPTLAIAVAVQEAFLHCAKAFKRSHLWQPETWPDRAEMPSLGAMIRDQAKLTDQPVEEIEQQIEEGYATRLY